MPVTCGNFPNSCEDAGVSCELASSGLAPSDASFAAVAVADCGAGGSSTFGVGFSVCVNAGAGWEYFSFHQAPAAKASRIFSVLVTSGDGSAVANDSAVVDSGLTPANLGVGLSTISAADLESSLTAEGAADGVGLAVSILVGCGAVACAGAEANMAAASNLVSATCADWAKRSSSSGLSAPNTSSASSERLRTSLSLNP